MYVCIAVQVALMHYKRVTKMLNVLRVLRMDSYVF